MTGQELFEWLQAIPEEDRKKAEITLEAEKFHPLIVGKFYRTPGSYGVPEKLSIYLIYK